MLTKYLSGETGAPSARALHLSLPHPACPGAVTGSAPSLGMFAYSRLSFLFPPSCKFTPMSLLLQFLLHTLLSGVEAALQLASDGGRRVG